MLDKSKILVVEPQTEVSQQLIDMLELLGYQVQAFSSGAGAIEVLDDSIRLIFCSVQLTDMSGYAFSIEVARCPYDIPVILLVSGTSYTTRKSVYECGAINYLCSPYVFEEVVAQVNMYIPVIDPLNTKIEDVSMPQILTLVAQETDNAIILTDADGSIEWVNHGFMKMTEYTLDDVIGLKPGNFLRGAESDLQAVNLLNNALRERRAFHTEVTNYTKSGQKYHVALYVEPIYRNGKVKHFIGIEQDITARVLLEDLEQETENLRIQLSKEEEINKLQSSFVTMVSHEFRTPLAIIQSASDTLTYHYDRLSQAQRQKRLSKINEQIRMLTSMMEDVLVIDHANGKNQQVTYQYADTQILCQNVVDAFYDQNISQKINFATELPSGNAYLDPDLFEQIVHRLLSNAIIYSHAHGIIEVRLYSSGTNLFLTITDNGIGIPSEDLPHVYEAFRRGSNVGQIHGIGMGLNIVKHAVTMMDGMIRVQSVEGEGTQVSVSIPAHK